MREALVEQYLVRRVKDLGGRAYKWVAPGNVGVPDRIVILPRGFIIFVEVKSDKGKLSAVQEIQHALLEGLGVTVYVVHSKEEVDSVLATYELLQ